MTLHATPFSITRDKAIAVAGVALVVDPSGAMYWPEEDTLIVADLHLGKALAYARRGSFLPPYDTADTLARLGSTLARFSPRRVVALGDSFHDTKSAPHAKDMETLRGLTSGREWTWIAGNHDPVPPKDVAGERAADLTIGPLRFVHEPERAKDGGVVAGHLHPVAKVRGGGDRRRCFATDGRLCVMPAFGALTGGLNVLDEAFTKVFPDGLDVYAMGRSAIYAISTRQCVPG